MTAIPFAARLDPYTASTSSRSDDPLLPYRALDQEPDNEPGISINRQDRIDRWRALHDVAALRTVV